MRTLKTVVVLVALGGLFLVNPVRARQGTSLPRVQAGDLAHLGTFKVPGSGFEYGGSALAFNPANNSIFMIGWNNTYASAELNIPALGGVATIRQALTDPFEGTRSLIGLSDSRIGGQLVYGGRLYMTAYGYYDADYIQQASHFSRPLSLTSAGDVLGPVRVSNQHSAGYYSGYMAPVPAEWQAAFGAPAVTGNCCIPILSRTSYGPSLHSFNPATMEATSDLVWYDGAHPLDTYGETGTHPMFNGATMITSVVFPAGTRTVLFLGRTGVGPYCYGDGEECNDPMNAAKGEHAYPYRAYVWAYDANDLLAVKNGSRQPWELRPYATWELGDLGGNNAHIGGATYDPATRRLYVAESGGDGGINPLIHVYQINAGTTSSDVTSPTVSMTGLTSGISLSGLVNLGATASDNVGVAGVWFTADGSILGPEDTTAPYQLAWNSGLLSNGAHQIRAVARDAAGNTSVSAPILVELTNLLGDNTPPSVALTAPSSGATVSGTIAISATASDSSGIANVRFTINDVTFDTDTTAPYSVNWNTTSTTGGSYVLRAVATDNSGNVTTSSARTITINNSSSDTTAPSVTVSGPANGSTVSGTINISATASDNVGVVGVRFTIDGTPIGTEDLSAPYQVAWSTTGSTNGTHAIRAVARDLAGNLATSSVITVTVSNAGTDTVAPAVSLTTPSSGATVTGSVTVTATATDNVGVASVQFFLDGTSMGTADVAAPFQLTWNTVGAPNGSHTLQAVARDAAGNSTTSVGRTVTVSNASSDTSRPNVSLTAPTFGQVLSGSVAVTATASDNVGVAGVRFTLDGANLGAEDTLAPYQVAWDTTTSTAGAHQLRAIARDAAGNIRTSSALTVVVDNSVADNTNPTVAISAPASGATVSNSVTLGATAGDNIGVVGVQFKIDGVNVGGEDTSAPYQLGWNAASVVNGTHTLTVVARDAAGNTATAVRQFIVKNQGTGVAGDLNGDSFPDLVFSHSSGNLHSWFMQYGSLVDDRPLTPGVVNPLWQIVSLDDFDGDKKTDILWQHAGTGQTFIWYMDGTTMVSSAYLAEAPTVWKVMATGDLNGDTRTDIIWQNPNTGEIYGWLMNGTTIIGEGAINNGAIDPTWRVAGSFDINKDGKGDLIWQNTSSGLLAYSLMNGVAILEIGGLNPGATNPAWRLKAVADFNRDGHMDFVWQHVVTSHLYIWYLNGTTLVNDHYLTPAQVNPAWQIVGSR